MLSRAAICSSRTLILSFSEASLRRWSVARAFAISSARLYTPRFSRLDSTSMRRSLSASRNSPYASCRIRAMEQKVWQSIPTIRVIFACVSFMVVSPSFSHSPVSGLSLASASVPLI